MDLIARKTQCVVSLLNCTYMLVILPFLSIIINLYVGCSVPDVGVLNTGIMNPGLPEGGCGCFLFPY